VPRQHRYSCGNFRARHKLGQRQLLSLRHSLFSTATVTLDPEDNSPEQLIRSITKYHCSIRVQNSHLTHASNGAIAADHKNSPVTSRSLPLCAGIDAVIFKISSQFPEKSPDRGGHIADFMLTWPRSSPLEQGGYHKAITTGFLARLIFGPPILPSQIPISPLPISKEDVCDFLTQF
jgi:hypothetical protein